MYKTIDAVEMAIAAAESPDGAVMCDRRRYAPFFEAAEQYAHKHDMIVGGDTATRMLLGEEPGPEDYFYDLYSARALDDARALTKIFYDLAPEGLGHYANMMTGVPRKEFTINVDERRLFRVKALEVHRGGRCTDIIVPSVRPANFARAKGGAPLPLLCMGPEIQLIDIYASLANPSRAGDWPALVRAEEALRKIYVDEVRDKVKGVGGGGEEPPVSALVEALAAEYIPRSGHVAVGGYATRVYSPGAGAHARLQIVTSNSFKEEERAVCRIASRMGFNVQTTMDEPKVPTDDRLRRMAIHVVRPGARREAVLYIYNSGEYELIPFVGASAPAEKKTGGRVARQQKKSRRRGPQSRSPQKKRRAPQQEEEGDNTCAIPTASAAGLPKGAPVGTPFVVMRFLLVEAWTIQLLHRMGNLSAQYARQVLRNLLDDYEQTAAAYVRLREAGDFDRIFPSGVDQYVGSYVDPILYEKRQRFGPAAKKAARGKRTYFPPYYPARDARLAKTP